MFGTGSQESPGFLTHHSETVDLSIVSFGEFDPGSE